jgi:hypothetical protein
LIYLNFQGFSPIFSAHSGASLGRRRLIVFPIILILATARRFDSV